MCVGNGDGVERQMLVARYIVRGWGCLGTGVAEFSVPGGHIYASMCQDFDAWKKLLAMKTSGLAIVRKQASNGN